MERHPGRKPRWREAVWPDVTGEEWSDRGWDWKLWKQEAGSHPRPSGDTAPLSNSDFWSLELRNTQLLFPNTNNQIIHYSTHGKAPETDSFHKKRKSLSDWSSSILETSSVESPWHHYPEFGNSGSHSHFQAWHHACLPWSAATTSCLEMHWTGLRIFGSSVCFPL